MTLVYWQIPPNVKELILDHCIEAPDVGVMKSKSIEILKIVGLPISVAKIEKLVNQIPSIKKITIASSPQYKINLTPLIKKFGDLITPYLATPSEILNIW